MTDQKPFCDNECVEPARFPKEIYNRPGLSRIDYRIGTYSAIRAYLMQKLNLNRDLEDWTYRGSDDPGIALLEGAAILGDILAFYQDLYANEAYLRTAQWRESVSDLVKLLGYRLSPGVGGSGTFAVEVKGEKTLTIPSGFPIKAELEDMEKPSVFETTEETTAVPALGMFELYRPRNTPASTIAAGVSSLEIETPDIETDPESLAKLDLKEGDRIMLVPDADMFDTQDSSYTDQDKPEILIIKEVKTVLDRTILVFEGALANDWATGTTAYPIGRSFNHFGHNAPIKITALDSTGENVEQSDTNFDREIWGTHSPGGTNSDYYPTLKKEEMPLDTEVDDLAAGGKLICHGYTTFDGQSTEVPFTVVKTIEEVRSDSLTWGHVSGKSTVAVVDSKLIKNDYISFEEADIRKMKFHEVVGPELTLRPLSDWDDGPFTDIKLNYFGTYDDVVALAGRDILFEHEDGTTEQLQVASKAEDFSLGDKDEDTDYLWTIELSADPEEFLLEDFDEEEPTVTVYGNLVEATEGKTEKEAVLGNGDSRQKFQTFKLPKAPLTYLTSSSETPPEVPELYIYVNDILWTLVPSFFGRGAKEQIYIVREDVDDNSWIQFGDGKTGARLPSGIDNVVAVYRTGVGSYGSLKEETSPKPAGKLKGIKKIYLPSLISGGDEAEEGDKARQAAPGKVQTLGRIVSLKDFEYEALAISGVSKALAKWKLVDKSPSIDLTILMEYGRQKEFENVEELIGKYDRERGTQRFRVTVTPGKRLYVYLEIEYFRNPSYREEKVEKAIIEAMGVATGERDSPEATAGLFALAGRRFGQSEYASRIEGTVQNVAGVEWVKIAVMATLGEAEKPSELDVTAKTDSDGVTIFCGSTNVLSLYEDHLVLKEISTETEGNSNG